MIPVCEPLKCAQTFVCDPVPVPATLGSISDRAILSDCGLRKDAVCRLVFAGKSYALVVGNQIVERSRL